MRLTDEGELKEVYCNHCGRRMRVNSGILEEGCFSIQYTFGYFSEKDGMTHDFDLCESCYDSITNQFKIPITQKEETELL